MSEDTTLTSRTQVSMDDAIKAMLKQQHQEVKIPVTYEERLSGFQAFLTRNGSAPECVEIYIRYLKRHVVKDRYINAPLALERFAKRTMRNDSRALDNRSKEAINTHSLANGQFSFAGGIELDADFVKGNMIQQSMDFYGVTFMPSQENGKGRFHLYTDAELEATRGTFY